MEIAGINHKEAFVRYCLTMYPMLSTGTGSANGGTGLYSVKEGVLNESGRIAFGFGGTVRDVVLAAIRGGLDCPEWHHAAIYAMEKSEQYRKVTWPELRRRPFVGGPVIGVTDRDGDTWYIVPSRLRVYLTACEEDCLDKFPGDTDQNSDDDDLFDSPNTP